MRTFSQQKAALTRAIKTKDYRKVEAECERTVAEWEKLPHGWPDAWHRWEIALSDAWSEARYSRDKRATDLPGHPATMDDLRYRVLVGS